MKYLIFVFALTACSSTPKATHTYGGALPEIMRAGVPEEQFPDYYHRVSHTCTSVPLYDLDGYYVRTVVRCH